MNSYLQGAITELKRAQAIGLPSSSTVEKSKGGSWRGKKKDGGTWSLTKNGESSYTCIC